MARFLSGINNHSENSLVRQNVRSMRFNLDGEARIVLFAAKTIKKGETLYYDYNEGGFSTYDTKDFV